jgi:hypothetical protein
MRDYYPPYYCHAKVKIHNCRNLQAVMLKHQLTKKYQYFIYIYQWCYSWINSSGNLIRPTKSHSVGVCEYYNGQPFYFNLPYSIIMSEII